MKRFLAVLLIAVVGLSTLPAQEEDPALYAVGALAASNLYNTYFLLGTLADGYASDAYPVSFARDLTRDVIGLSETAVEVLRELMSSEEVVSADRQLVQQMIAAHTSLINQAWGLINYIDDSSQTEDWFAYKEEAWLRITAILGIDDE